MKKSSFESYRKETLLLIQDEKYKMIKRDDSNTSFEKFEYQTIYGKLTISIETEFDRKATVLSIYTRFENPKDVKDNYIVREMNPYSGKLNMHCFEDDLLEMLDKFDTFLNILKP
jgi:hypothetical protein